MPNLDEKLAPSPIRIFNDQIRDQLDLEGAREIWSNYYFRVLSEEFHNSHFFVESSMGEDPHEAAIKRFKKNSHYKTGLIIAREDRKHYSNQS